MANNFSSPKIGNGLSLSLSTVSLDSCGSSYYDGRKPGRRMHRRYSQDSAFSEGTGFEEEPEIIQKRLFEQKYKSLTARKEKRTIDRSVRITGRPRDKYFQLPDDLCFALDVACGTEPFSKLPPIPQILKDGEPLSEPNTDRDGCGLTIPEDPEPVRDKEEVTRGEREVRIADGDTIIVEKNNQSTSAKKETSRVKIRTPRPKQETSRPKYQTPRPRDKAPSSKSGTSSVKELKPGTKEHAPSPIGPSPSPRPDSKQTDNEKPASSSTTKNRSSPGDPKPTEITSSSRSNSASAAASAKRTGSAFKNSSKRGPGGGPGQGHPERCETPHSQRGCGRRHDSAASRDSRCRPTSTSTVRSARPPTTVRRKKSRSEGGGRRRQSRVERGEVLVTVSGDRHSDSADSDYFDSDSDIHHALAPSDVNKDLALYRRACKVDGVVTSRRVEEGLTSGKLEASYSQLTRQELKAICVAIVESDTVSKVDLAGNDLCERSLSYLQEVFEENSHIKYLCLSDCHADRQGIGQLIQCLHRADTLTTLDISGIKLCLEQVGAIAKYIQASKALEHLSLSYCEIDEIGGTVLGDALQSAKSLSYLDLSWNQLRMKGATNVCLALKENHSVSQLDLSWNGLGREGCAALEMALKTNTCLKHLDISSNRIGVLGLECLLKGLHRNSTLSTLKIGNNPFPTDSASAVINTLTNSPNSAITYLDLSHIAVEDEFIRLLNELRKSRVLYVCHGHVMSRGKDLNGDVAQRSLTSFDPILVLFEYMKLQNLRLIDLFRSLDSNSDHVISKQELRSVFMSLNMSLPQGSFDSMFNKIDVDHNNSIDMDELKLVHKRVMRQARALKARAGNSVDDEYGDVMHDFQNLVRKAVASRRSPRPSRVGTDLSTVVSNLLQISPRGEKSLRVSSAASSIAGSRKSSVNLNV